MKIKILSGFNSRFGFLISESIQDFDAEYSKYLIKIGLAEAVQNVAAGDTTNTTSERADNPKRSKRQSKDSCRPND
jgi:hypothetical protein